MTSGWGWSDKEKWEELTHESAWLVECVFHTRLIWCSIFFSFLVAREAETKKPKAFVSFRFDLDEQIEVLYW